MKRVTLLNSFIIVPLGDWEKNPRLQAKTLVCLRYGKVPRIQPYRLRFKISPCVDHEVPQADLAGRDQGLVAQQFLESPDMDSPHGQMRSVDVP